MGRFQIKDLSPVAVRAMRDSIKVKLAPSTADSCVMLISVLWRFAIEFCQLELGHNPALGVARVHTEKKPREAWPDRGDEIYVVQEKTGTPVWIPLHRELRTLLDSVPRLSDTILVTSWGRPFSSSQSLYEKIKIALKRAGEGKYVPHGLRATAAVRLIEAGCSEDLAAAITGHRDMNVLRGYVRGADQRKLARQAMRKLEGS